MKDVTRLYDGPPVADADVLSIYVVLNGTLGMSPGKAAAQAFHCGWLFCEGAKDLAWEDQGRRVTVRTAETAFVFERVIRECAGFVQYDEGLTEVERGAATAFVSIPYTRGGAPKILSHKRVQLA